MSRGWGKPQPLSWQVRVLHSNVVTNNNLLQWQADSKALVLPLGGTAEQGSNGDPIRAIFAAILEHLDAGNCALARASVVDLGERLKVSQGHVPRPRGGIQYRPEYMLDCVHFLDSLRPLRDETDVMRNALEKPLCVIRHFFRKT